MYGCEKYMELMSLMLDGELTREQASELRTHIASCENCRRVFDAFTGVSEALSDELVEPPEAMAQGVLFTIKNRKKHRRFSYGKFTALAACLALILLGAAKFGFLNGSDGSATSMDEGVAYSVSEADSSAQDNSTVGASAGTKYTREQIKKGVKLEKTDDGTVYQLGFPLQNAQLLEGEKPEKVEKEPAWLLDAKKIEVYKGNWYSEEELKKQSEDRSTAKSDKTSKTDADAKETKSEALATVTDDDALTEIGELLTAVPDDTTQLTVDSEEFTASQPIYTLYVPVEKDAESLQPKKSDVATASESRESASSTSESKANSFRESLESVKNNLLNKSDDAKASPSPSPDASSVESDARPQHRHNIAISVYYVKGEIWCVARRVDSDDADAPSDDTDSADKAKATEKSSPSPQSDTGAKVSTSAQPSSSASPSAGTEMKNLLPKIDRILYKASGSPEKLDELLKKLESTGNVRLTESSAKKSNG